MAPKKKKRPGTNTAAEQSRIMAGAFVNISPPPHIKMPPGSMSFFHDIIEEFAKAEWTKHSVTVAALLARSMFWMESEQNLLHKEGCVAKSDRGTPVVNPRKSCVQMYAGTILALRRSLALHARAQGNNPDQMANRTKSAKALENMAAAMDDDLIARPKLN